MPPAYAQISTHRILTPLKPHLTDMHHDVTIWGKDLLTYFASCVYAYHPPTYTVRKGNIAVDGRWEVFSSRSNCVCDRPGDTDERAWTRQHESAKRPWRIQHLCFWHLPTENKNAEQKAWARFGYNCASSVACGVLQGTATFFKQPLTLQVCPFNL